MKVKKRIRPLINWMIKPGIERKTISVFFGFFILVICIAMTACVAISRKNAEAMILRNLNSLTIQKNEEMDQYFSRMNDLAITASYSTWLQKLFELRSDIYRKQETRENVTAFLSGLEKFYDGARFAVILDDGTMISDYEGRMDYMVNLSQKDWYDQLVEERNYVEMGRDAGVYKAEGTYRSSDWFINMYYLILNNYSLDQEGVFMVNIPKSTIEELLKTDFTGSYAELYDEDGGVITGNISEEIKNGTGIYCQETSVSIRNRKLKLVVYLDKGALVMEQREIWLIFAGIVVIAAILFLSLAIFFSRSLTVPILQCVDAMHEIQNGCFGVSLENRYQDEIGALLKGFNEMSGAIQDLIEKNESMRLLQKETQYQVLLHQINPHFLNNTLELINGLILNGESDTALMVCESLGRMFRYNLSSNKWVTVREEWDYIRQYLTIMKFKIKNLSIYYEMEEAILEKRFLKSTLQPLVENSISHGFRNSTKECCLNIMIGREKGGIRVVVLDNGVGMNEERLKGIQEEIEKTRKNPVRQADDEAGHIGIRNVFHRLYLEYGEELQFEIISKVNAGTQITFFFPEKDEPG